MIAFEGMLPGGEWRFQRDGRPAALAVTPRLTVNDALAAILAAERGDGITGALSYMVAPQLAAGRLVTLLDGVLAAGRAGAARLSAEPPARRQGPRLRRLRGAAAGAGAGGRKVTAQ